MYWYNNNVNNNTQPQTKSDKEILNTARDKMDCIVNYNWHFYASCNKLRKKLKRWFDRCKKKKIEENNTKKGELCYKIDKQTNAIYMGKKGSTNDNRGFQLPYISIGIDNFEYNIYCRKENESQQVEKKDLLKMSCDDFHELYRKAVGYCWPIESLLDVYDGFMSWTQVPRQLKLRKAVKAKSVGGHAANIATRVFSPVLAVGAGLYYGAKAAYKGAKVLKDKIIPTEEELNRMKRDKEEELYKEYANTTNEALNRYQAGLINRWKSGKMYGMHYNDIKRTLDSNQKIYGNPPKKNLNVVNNAASTVQQL